MILLATFRVVENHGLKNRQKTKHISDNYLIVIMVIRRTTKVNTHDWQSNEGQLKAEDDDDIERGEKQRDDTFEFANWRETQSRQKEKQVGTSSRSSVQHSQCVRVCVCVCECTWVYVLYV